MASQVPRTEDYCVCAPDVRNLVVEPGPGPNEVQIRCRTCGGSGNRQGGRPAVREVHVYQGHPDVLEVIHEDDNVFTITSAQIFNYRAWKLYRQWYFEQYKVVHDVSGQKEWDRMIGDWGYIAEVVAVDDEDPEMVHAQAIITKLQSRKPKQVLDHLLSFAEFSIPTVRRKWDFDGVEKEAVLVLSDNIQTVCKDRLSLVKFSHICRKNKWTISPSRQIRWKGRRYRIWFFDPDFLFPDDHAALESDTTFMGDEINRMLAQQTRQTSLDQDQESTDATQESNGAHSGNGQVRKPAGEKKTAPGNGTPKATGGEHVAGGNGKQPVGSRGNGRGTTPLVRMPAPKDMTLFEEGMKRGPRPIDHSDLNNIHYFVKKLQEDHGYDGPSSADLEEASGYPPTRLREVLKMLYEEGKVYQHREDHWRAI